MAVLLRHAATVGSVTAFWSRRVKDVEENDERNIQTDDCLSLLAAFSVSPDSPSRAKGAQQTRSDWRDATRPSHDLQSRPMQENSIDM